MASAKPLKTSGGTTQEFGGTDTIPLGNIPTSLPVTVNTQTSSYTAVLADAGVVVEMNSGSANNFTIPPNSSVAFPVGTIIGVYQMGAGLTTIVAGSGVTIRNVGAMHGQYAEASLRKRATDEWVLTGYLA